MRIAAKRLRYVLEATGFCFGKPGDAGRRAARDLQDLLGEIHDADVMLPRLAEHRARMRAEDAASVRRSAGAAGDVDAALAGRAPHRTAYRGLETYEVFLLARRALLHERFCELVRDAAGAWRLALAGQGGRPGARGGAAAPRGGGARREAAGRARGGRRRAPRRGGARPARRRGAGGSRAPAPRLSS